MKVLFIDRGVGADLYVNPTVTDEQYKALVAYLDAAQPLPLPGLQTGKVLSLNGLLVLTKPFGTKIGAIWTGSLVTIEAISSGYAKITSFIPSDPQYLQIVK